MIRLKTYFFLFLLLTILASCKEDDDKPDKPNYGIQYFDCKVNGEFFQAVSIPFQCNGPVFDYYPEAYMSVPEGFMVLGGTDCRDYSTIGIRLYGYQGVTGLIFFSDTLMADSISPFYSYFDDNEPGGIVRENLIDGYVNIEQLVPRASGNSPFGTIKGTFEFTVADESGIDTIRVTEGHFRFDVPQIF